MPRDEENPAPSVFRTPDQQEMIARLDAVEDDDVETAFFSTSAQEAEDAAVRMFDLGIRTLGSEQEAIAASSFPSRGTVEPPTSEVSTAEPAAVPVGEVSTEPSFEDPLTRRAFILGGPAALGLVD